MSHTPMIDRAGITAEDKGTCKVIGTLTANLHLMMDVHYYDTLLKQPMRVVYASKGGAVIMTEENQRITVSRSYINWQLNKKCNKGIVLPLIANA